MGLYGKLSNATRSAFVFDKIYPNKKAMDADKDDGIFIGRYVLIDYNAKNGEGYEKNTYNNYLKNAKDDGLDLVSESDLKTANSAETVQALTKRVIIDTRTYDGTVWVKQSNGFLKVADLHSVPAGIRKGSVTFGEEYFNANKKHAASIHSGEDKIDLSLALTGGDGVNPFGVERILNISLPSVGKLACLTYDMLYGEQRDTGIVDLPADVLAVKKPWLLDKNERESKNNGQTVRGVINIAQSLIGNIYKEKSKGTLTLGEVLDNSTIYYDNGKYYQKVFQYTISNVNRDNITSFKDGTSFNAFNVNHTQVAAHLSDIYYKKDNNFYHLPNIKDYSYADKYLISTTAISNMIERESGTDNVYVYTQDGNYIRKDSYSTELSGVSPVATLYVYKLGKMFIENRYYNQSDALLKTPPFSSNNTLHYPVYEKQYFFNGDSQAQRIKYKENIYTYAPNEIIDISIFDSVADFKNALKGTTDADAVPAFTNLKVKKVVGLEFQELPDSFSPNLRFNNLNTYLLRLYNFFNGEEQLPLEDLSNLKSIKGFIQNEIKKGSGNNRVSLNVGTPITDTNPTTVLTSFAANGANISLTKAEIGAFKIGDKTLSETIADLNFKILNSGGKIEIKSLTNNNLLNSGNVLIGENASEAATLYNTNVLNLKPFSSFTLSTASSNIIGSTSNLLTAFENITDKVHKLYDGASTTNQLATIINGEYNSSTKTYSSSKYSTTNLVAGTLSNTNISLGTLFSNTLGSLNTSSVGSYVAVGTASNGAKTLVPKALTVSLASLGLSAAELNSLFGLSASNGEVDLASLLNKMSNTMKTIMNSGYIYVKPNSFTELRNLSDNSATYILEGK